jgi:hypothetical protein
LQLQSAPRRRQPPFARHPRHPSPLCILPLHCCTNTTPLHHQPKLLEAIKPLKRGLAASEEDQEAIEGLVQQLERLNPTPQPLASPLLNGRWRLVRSALQMQHGSAYELLVGSSLWHTHSVDTRPTECTRAGLHDERQHPRHKALALPAALWPHLSAARWVCGVGVGQLGVFGQACLPTGRVTRAGCS